jgi:hypothetical protein
MNTSTKKLSAYTIASNCSDLSDIHAGIEEIQQYITACDYAGKTPSNTALIRLFKLREKQRKLTK